jgi:hypothetical protein
MRNCDANSDVDPSSPDLVVAQRRTGVLLGTRTTLEKC